MVPTRWSAPSTRARRSILAPHRWSSMRRCAPRARVLQALVFKVRHPYLSHRTRAHASAATCLRCARRRTPQQLHFRVAWSVRCSGLAGATSTTCAATACAEAAGLQGAPTIPPAPHARPHERCNLFEVRTPSYTPTVAISSRVVCSLLRHRGGDVAVRFICCAPRCATDTIRTARARTRALQLV
jgi:hypothetical protein